MVHLFSNKKISLVIRFCGMKLKLKLNYVSSNSPLWLDSTMWVKAKLKIWTLIKQMNELFENYVII